jgi:hypothetical protein
MSPALLLLLLIATASAALAHLLWGRRWVQIPVFLLAALAGALIVYALNLRLPIALPTPAGVPVLEVVFGVWALLVVASRLRL